MVCVDFPELFHLENQSLTGIVDKAKLAPLIYWMRPDWNWKWWKQLSSAVSKWKIITRYSVHHCSSIKRPELQKVNYFRDFTMFKFHGSVSGIRSATIFSTFVVFYNLSMILEFPHSENYWYRKKDLQVSKLEK